MSSRPSGDVTFLFTDIEGSTRLWEQYPDAMKVALARHDALLRDIFEGHGGYVFKTMGDAFLVAFPSAEAAVQAAVTGQHALRRETWETVGEIKVRVSLHSGEAEERDGDYFGPALNRAARLLSAGHGGQILLSLATSERLAGWPDMPGELRDMGERRLKDLIKPERLYQLVVVGLPSEFPPLKTLDARPNNLPAQPTALIGRERELEAGRQMLRRADVRLVTLTGPGGIGKTRLGLQIAAEVVDEFEHGAFFVPLEIRDPAQVPSVIAETLGIRETPGRGLAASLKEGLRDKQLLLILDNFEQVIDAAPFVAELMVAAPRLEFIVTSRSPLRILGETEVQVPTLGLPGGVRLPELDTLRQFPAVALFVQRAADAKAGFELTEDNAEAIVEICRRLDGLPLAIELAAARVKILQPQAMLGRLENRLKLLTGGARDLPSRQQTMRGAISWSYELLTEEEKRVFHRLAVFQGGFTLEAGERVSNAEGDLEEDILDTVSSLVDKSLLRQEEMADGETRFGMLQTIREFGLELLEEIGETETVRGTHAHYYRELAELAEPKLTGARQTEWLNRLDVEASNLRAALEWLVESGDITAGCQMGGALWRFWSTRGHLTEGRRQLEAILEQGDAAGARAHGPAGLAARAKALHGAGTLCAQQGDYDTARAHYEESITIRRELGEKSGVANLLNNLGVLARWQGAYPTARAYFEESLALLRDLNDPPVLGSVLNNLGLVMQNLREHERARALLEESLATRRAVGDEWGVANSLNTLGEVLLDQGNYAAAGPALTESLALYQRLGDPRAIAFVLEGLGALAAAQARPERALTLAGAAAALRQDINAPLSPEERVTLDRRLAPARASLSAAAQSAATQAGMRLSWEQAVHLALNHDTS